MGWKSPGVKNKRFKQCKSPESPHGKHSYVSWREKENGKWVILGTHCKWCGHIGSHVAGR